MKEERIPHRLPCPACPGRRSRHHPLCRPCMTRLPLWTRVELWRRDGREPDRTRQILERVHAGIPLDEIVLTSRRPSERSEEWSPAEHLPLGGGS